MKSSTFSGTSTFQMPSVFSCQFSSFSRLPSRNILRITDSIKSILFLIQDLDPATVKSLYSCKCASGLFKSLKSCRCYPLKFNLKLWFLSLAYEYFRCVFYGNLLLFCLLGFLKVCGCNVSYGFEMPQKINVQTI